MNLLDEIVKQAAEFNLVVDFESKGVCISAPDGFQFEPELHGLVSSQWDNEPMPNVYRRALKDIREYGPNISPCPSNCPCKE